MRPWPITMNQKTKVEVGSGLGPQVQEDAILLVILFDRLPKGSTKAGEYYANLFDQL